MQQHQTKNSSGSTFPEGDDSPKVPLLISEELYKELEDSLSESGFSSVEDFASYALRIALGKRNAKTTGVEQARTQELSDEESEIVTGKLKALGYI